MDRNYYHTKEVVQGRVVPRKGDVDRNLAWQTVTSIINASSPARGTWIEIPVRGSEKLGRNVVPRKGDVDRNIPVCKAMLELGVVPRKGDVDRNT